MKHLLSVVLFMVFGFSLYAQTTFNKRMRYGFPAVALTSIIATDSCYYATGVIADTVPPFNPGNIFLKLALDGEPEDFKVLTSTEKTYATWYKDLQVTSDGGFMVQGYTVDSTMKAMVVRYSELGEVISLWEYLSPYWPEFGFFQPRGGMVLLPDGGCAVLSALTVSDFPDSDLHLMRLDADGGIVWEVEYGGLRWDRPQSMAVTPEGSIICGAIVTNENMVTEGYTYQCRIVQFDSDGLQEWSYNSPTAVLRDAANDMLLLDDGSLIVASGVGHEQERPSVNVVYFDKYIFKLNPQHEVEWELTFPDPELSGNSYTSALLELSDGSGYIMTGREHEPNPFPGVGYTVRGWLGKVSPMGDSVWTRQYAYITEASNRHYLHDIKEASDGGLILCGEAREDGSQANYPQQAWLLKLDGHGCLVPGCHLLDSTVEGEAPEIRLAIYPNPTSDYLNFQLRGIGIDLPGFGNPAGLTIFRITDANGRVVKEFTAGGRNDTYIVPVWEWGAGVYFLQYLKGGRVITNQKFIKQ